MTGGASPLALFGTEQPVPERRLVKAGPLSTIFESGNLRTISFAGIEVVRAVNYLARDSSWGTYDTTLSNMEIAETNDVFSISYDGLCEGNEGRYAYRMTIKGEASGRLTMEAVGEALTDFPTNRTGFVVLHPAEAAGGRLTIRHSDGQIEETVFPDAISPDQPAFDISALTHQPAPGLTCTIEMEGDAFEMEDQRNWADASFKTYVRPLSKPRPYLIAKSERDVQTISIVVAGQPLLRAASSSDGATLTLGGPNGPMPSMALFVDVEDLKPAIAHADAIGGPQAVVRFDPARGHDAAALAEAARFAAQIGASLAVEAIFDARNPAEEAERFAQFVRAAKIRPSAVLVSPRRELKMRPSNTLPSGERPIAELVHALRVGKVAARIGAGTPSFFTEFNRNPPTGDADFVFFSVASSVHAADDASVMETVGVYPAIIASARKLCPGKPIWLGPCTIGMRHNPYGANVAANPTLLRKPAAGLDPRHGALFGAAFATGVAAKTVAAGVDHLTLAAPTGPFGLLDDDGTPRPLQKVHAILAAAAGSPSYDVTFDRADVAAVAFRADSQVRILVANLGSASVGLRLPAVPLSGEVIGGRSRLEMTRAQPDIIVVEPYRTISLMLPGRR